MAFKMKGSPIYRNFGVGDSPNKTMGYEVKIEKGKVVSEK